jgi:hypothetical protein
LRERANHSNNIPLIKGVLNVQRSRRCWRIVVLATDNEKIVGTKYWFGTKQVWATLCHSRYNLRTSDEAGRYHVEGRNRALLAKFL